MKKKRIVKKQQLPARKDNKAKKLQSVLDSAHGLIGRQARAMKETHNHLNEAEDLLLAFMRMYPSLVNPLLGLHSEIKGAMVKLEAEKD